MWSRRSFLSLTAGAVSAHAQSPPGDIERSLIASRRDALGKKIAALRGRVDGELLAEAEVYHKALIWLLADDEEFHRRIYSHDALNVAASGFERAEALAQGESPWTTERGTVCRAYRSRIDGSVQPYSVWVPARYDPESPGRLDVILHGRNSRLNEVSFLAAAERERADGPDHLVLEVFGRTNNAYRWSGEEDVFEALDAVRRHYAFDERRVVLRGFSMGGAGTWHLGLHHPGRWAAIEAGAGFTDTLVYADKSLPGGLKGPWQRKALHIYDAVDYAENAWNVPTVGYGGEIDAQLQASVNIREALAEAGAAFLPDGLNWATSSLKAVFLVGPETPHRFHPASKARSEAFLAKAAEQGRPDPDRIRFVTYTTKYPHCFWATADGLEAHYERAEIRARRDPGRTQLEATTANISRLVLRQAEGLRRLQIDGQELSPDMAPTIYLGKAGGRWRQFDSLATLRGGGPVKRPGLQGPIDDAFTAPFLAVKPDTGTSPVLELFRKEYRKWLRAEVPVVSAGDVGAAEIAENHLVLFGTPQTNALLGRVAGRLPRQWTPGCG